jgi:addiction module HigA family antidote
MSTSTIQRHPTRVPLPISNPAAALIRDTLEHHRVSQVEAARAMKISPAQLSDVIRQRKSVSGSMALRVQACFGVPAGYLIALQAQHDFRKAYHSKNDLILQEVEALA